MAPSLAPLRRTGRALRRAAGPLARAQGSLAEAALGCLAAARGAPPPPEDPRSILVLRNNDIGDLLVVTPLFEALRRRFPACHLAAAVGRWNLGVLRGNPHLSEVLAVDAPWFNKFVPRQSALARLAFVALSPQARELARRRFEVGIDVLGSRWGSLLLLRAGVPYRLGVRGYAGGHGAAQSWVAYDPQEHVGRAALRFAELLGARELPPCRPQIFLEPQEVAAAEGVWRALAGGGRLPAIRLLVGPGGGLAARRWPAERYRELLTRLAADGRFRILVAGGPRERGLGEEVTAGAAGAHSLAGHLSLRELFAVTARADLVVTNSSMLMHAAAAFDRPTRVLLGESFPSARHHDAQWGYPGTCRSLGAEPGVRGGMATPAQALAAVLEGAAGLARGSANAA